MHTPRIIAALGAAASLAMAAGFAGAQTIDFGSNLPAGPVPTGYSGFDWGSGANQAINSGPDASIFYLTDPAASIVEFGKNDLFNLNSVDYQILISGETGLGSFFNYTTVVSGYLDNTLVKSVTENYPGNGGDLFTNLDIDGVNKVTFSTTNTYGYLDGDGNPVITTTNAPSATFVDELKVSNFTKAPEIDPTSTIGALTLLAGCLAVFRGRRAHPRLAAP